uniref:Ribosomal RNA processing 1 n=1 Tax=Colobus angolensis palliatus TaxID=336983 RepID=A0A2K5K9W2_COLAP
MRPGSTGTRQKLETTGRTFPWSLQGEHVSADALVSNKLLSFKATGNGHVFLVCRVGFIWSKCCCFAAGGFTHDELLKVWKGLFYCMWMQDKPLLQEELGRTISQLVHAFQTTEAQHLFLQAFWQTMNREWTGIDRLRLDKFYMLMRMVLNESLKVLKMRGWEERQIEELLELLTSEILHPSSQAPHGVKSHFIEIFLEELTKVGAEELTADQNLKFIDPFCRIAARTKDSLVLNNITRGIFEAIVEQAPLAIEDLLNELDAQDGEAASDSEESSEGGERGDALSRKRSEKPPAGSVCRAEPEAGEQTGDDRDSGGPVLQFDYEAVANRLFEMASRQSTPSQNRKRLYKVDEIPEKACRRLLEGRRQKKTKKQKRLLRLQRERGRTSWCVSRGAGRRRTPRQLAGARAKAANVQEPEKKKKRGE